MQLHARRARPSALSEAGTVLIAVLFILTDVHGVHLRLPAGAAGDQLLLTEGDTLSLGCEDASDVRLSFPALALYQPETIPQVMHRRTTGLWNATLTLRSARPVNTGYYNCSSLADRTNTASVYVYVKSKDPERLWVLDPTEKQHLNIIAQYSAPVGATATLDCRPNDPSTVVTLRDAKNRTLAPGRQADGAELRWEPRLGFRLGPVALHHAGAYWCAAQGRPANTDLQLSLAAVAAEVVPPVVGADRALPLPKGSDAILRCELATPRSLNFNLSWAAPTGRVNEGYRWMAFGAANDTKAWHKQTKLLYLYNVKDSDTGDYTCTADDMMGNRRSSVFRLEVEGASPSDLTRTAAPSDLTRTAAPSTSNEKPADSTTTPSGAGKHGPKTEFSTLAIFGIVATIVVSKCL